jgi:Holliday junction resolvase RusA-like endonuclease
MRIFYASRRPDLDESLILDLLQDVAYVNDRQVKEKHIYWGLDKDNPRTEMLIEQIPKVV